MSVARRTWPWCSGVVIRDRLFGQDDVVLIRRMIREHPAWGRTQLSQALCDALRWKQTNGRWKERACRVALLRLEALGLIALPKRKVENGGKPPTVKEPERAQPGCTLRRMPATVTAQKVENSKAAREWNAVVAAYHYLGLKTPVGRTIRYLLYGDGELVGATSFSECAWSVKARDQALRDSGLDAEVPRDAMVANNRFLVLPWIEVPNLASRLLALSLRALCGDWHDKYGVQPLLAETFVDPQYFLGTCYRAAGWIQVGETRGFAKRGSTHIYQSRPKLVFLRGLTQPLHQGLQARAIGRAA